MEDLIAEVVRVWSSTTDPKRTLLVILLAAFFVACIRSARMSLAKFRRLKEKTPSSISKIGFCPGGAMHNFPVGKRGQTVKCRNCPKTFRR